MNKSGNENRSVRSTKKRLKQALMTLLQEKPVNSIKVSELTELADVNRGTFYFHYSDIYDMLHKLEAEFFSEFEEVLNTDMPHDRQDGILYLKKIYTFLKKNDDICRMYFHSNFDMSFFNKLKKLIGNKCCSLWESVHLHMSEKYTELYNAFIINGCAGVLQQWMEHDFEESPEEIATLVATIISSSLLPCADPVPDHQQP